MYSKQTAKLLVCYDKPYSFWFYRELTGEVDFFPDFCLTVTD